MKIIRMQQFSVMFLLVLVSVMNKKSIGKENNSRKRYFCPKKQK